MLHSFEQLTPLPALPVVPNSWETSHELRRILQDIFINTPRLAHDVFQTKGNFYQAKPLAKHWGKDNVTVLVNAGLLTTHESGGYMNAPYLITEWADNFYLTDFPDTGHEFEVFSPHVEQHGMVDSLTIGPCCCVIEPFVGSGILLLEAVRRGNTGIGIDMSPRALAFARYNADLNGLADRVEFRLGDIQDELPAAIAEINDRPIVILANPPFEPGGEDRPKHSAAGVDGTDALEAMQKIFSGLPPIDQQKISQIHIVTFSLGRKSKQQNTAASDLVVAPIMAGMAEAFGGQCFLKELRRPSAPLDYIRNIFPNDTGEDQTRVADNIYERGYRGIHLVTVSIYCGSQSINPAEVLHWQPYRNNAFGIGPKIPFETPLHRRTMPRKNALVP